MIITRERLIQLAQREVKRQAAVSDILSAYLIGSVARGEPLLGGTADVDLVLIHEHRPALEHEVVRLSDDVHLDITHHSRELYENPRSLRTDPWLGPSMCEPVFLYDPEHFFEWSQAGVRGQFHRADHVHARSLEFLQRSREANASLNGNGTWLKKYMQATMQGANAAASLTGFPAAGRRLTLSLERKTAELGQNEAYQGFLCLIGAAEIDSWNLPEWLSSCGRAYDAASKVTDNPEFETPTIPPRKSATYEVVNLGSWRLGMPAGWIRFAPCPPPPFGTLR